MRRILVLESVTSYCGRERIAGVFRYARTHGGWEIRLLNESEESLRLGRFDYAEADGVIVSAKVPVPKTLKLRPETTVYVSYLCRYADAKWSKVCNDNAALAEACAAHLSARKCVSYAYFRYLDIEWAVDRGDAFAAAMRARGFAVDLFAPHTTADWRKEKRAILEWLRALPKPCGLLAGSDGWAQILLDLARTDGIRVPDDLCVVGVDNDPSVCELTIPTLSSFDPLFRNEGYLAAELLDRKLSGAVDPRKPVCIKNRGGAVVERASSAFCLRTHTCAVKARELIRVNASVGIGIDELARRCKVSRRLLELRFRECYGHSVNEELLLVRVEAMKNALRNTNLPVCDICAMSGFSSLNHAAKVFKDFTGETMTQFRRITT